MTTDMLLDPPKDKPHILHTKTLDTYKNKKYKKRFDVSDHSGLGVRVFESGQVSFHYRYRFEKKAKRLTLEKYPALSLSKARAMVPTIRQLLKENKDPALHLYNESGETKATLDECLDLFLTKRVVKLRESTQSLYTYSLNKHALGAFKIPVEDITIKQWYEFF